MNTNWLITKLTAANHSIDEYVHVEDPASGRQWIGQIVQMHDRANKATKSPGNREEDADYTIYISIVLQKIGSTFGPVTDYPCTEETIIKSATDNDLLTIRDAAALTQTIRITSVARIRAGGEAKIKGFATTLLDDKSLRDQLLNTHHFGSLIEIEDVYPVGDLLSRYDYVVMQCALLLDAKQGWPGAGLSSESSILYGGRKLSRLEVCQAWAIIVNTGHLFGTFASERALFFQIESDRGLRRDILRYIERHDSQLKKDCEKILQQSNLHHLFYVMAAWRACDLFEGDRLKTVLDLLKLFLGQPQDQHTRRLKWIFRFTRQVAYNIIHTSMSAGIRIDALTERNITGLAALDPIIFDEHADEDIPLAPLMRACDAYHGDATFASAEAASAVLAHIRAFKKWWNATTIKESSDKLRALFGRPMDWPEVDSEELTHFVRLRLLGEHTEWLPQVRSWYNADWQSSNFLISPSPGQKGLICDIYVGLDGLKISTVTHIAGLLAQQSAISWSTEEPTEIERNLWRSVALFGARIFESALQSGLRLRLDPVNAEENHSNYAILAPTFETGRARLTKLFHKLHDEERGREFEAIVEVSESMVSNDKPWLLFLARTKIVDETGQDVAEIDGLWAQFYGDRVEWTVLEVKARAQTGAAGQLQRKVLSCIRFPARVPVTEGGSGHRYACSSFSIDDNIKPR